MMITHRSRTCPWHLDLAGSRSFLLLEMTSRSSLPVRCSLQVTNWQTTHTLQRAPPSSSENPKSCKSRSFSVTRPSSFLRSLRIHVRRKNVRSCSRYSGNGESEWRSTVWIVADKHVNQHRCSFAVSLGVYVRAVYRSVTFRRFSRHVVAYETLSAWSTREREPHASRVLVIARSTERPSTPELAGSRSCRSSCSRSSRAFPLPSMRADFDASTLSTASLPTLSLSLQNAFPCISLPYFHLFYPCFLCALSSLSLQLSLPLSLSLADFHSLIPNVRITR